MTKNWKLRFAVADRLTRYSTVWGCHSEKSGVYVYAGNMGAMFKASFHPKEFSKFAQPGASRAHPTYVSWQRHITPARFMDGISSSLALAMIFPTDCLAGVAALGKFIRIDRAPPGCAVILRMQFTKHSEQEVHKAFGSRLIGSTTLIDGECVFWDHAIDLWNLNDFTISVGPRASGDQGPTFIIKVNNPVDGQFLTIEERSVP